MSPSSDEGSSEGSDVARGPLYCAYYCEENIWHLCADPRVDADERRVLFICNRAHKVAMWGQRIAEHPDLPIAWDYHVILLARASTRGPQWQAWDLDARAPCPQPASTWLDHSFKGIALLPPELEPNFRLVEADVYRRRFRSDRRHMRKPDGTSIQPPPSWPIILGEPFREPLREPDDGSNLARFLDIDDREFVGERFDLPGLRRWLRQSEAAGRTFG
jgi:hypothetical protein